MKSSFVLVVLTTLVTSNVNAYRFRPARSTEISQSIPFLVGSTQIRGGAEDKEEENSSISAKAVSVGFVVVALSVIAQQLSTKFSWSLGKKEATPVADPIIEAVDVELETNATLSTDVIDEEIVLDDPVIDQEANITLDAATPNEEVTILDPATEDAAPLVARAVEPDSSVAFKTLISTVLTSSGLLAVLFGANLPDVTNFYKKLGLPEKIFGVPPCLYAAFTFLTFASSVVTDLVVGGVSAAVVIRPTETPSAEWYASLKKPSWNPPGWVFPIMWLVISKPTQLLALRQMFLASKPDWAALGIYCVHLALGNAWNDVFFRFQNTGVGLTVILWFWATLVLSTVLFYLRTEWAGYLMLPTCAWVTVAAALNWSIHNLNKGEESKKES